MNLSQGSSYSLEHLTVLCDCFSISSSALTVKIHKKLYWNSKAAIYSDYMLVISVFIVSLFSLVFFCNSFVDINTDF